eukprot:CFRG4120T1
MRFTGTVLVGIGFPYVDRHYIGTPHTFNRDWSSVVRCLGLLVGISYACAKLPNTTSSQLSTVVAVLGLGLWWCFDRSRQGLLLSLVFSFFGTICGQILAYSGVLWYTHPDFILVRSWFPSILFSACISFGNVGRQLAVEDFFETDCSTPESFGFTRKHRLFKLKTS